MFIRATFYRVLIIVSLVPLIQVALWTAGSIKPIVIFFGSAVECRVQDQISMLPQRMLPVGSAIRIPTYHAKIPWLIVAPTMEMPESIPVSQVARTFGAILRIVSKFPELSPIYCPGLGTGVGQVDPQQMALIVKSTYEEWKRSYEESV